MDKDWIIEKAKAEDGQEIGAGLLARDPVCQHPATDVHVRGDKVVCDACGKTL